MNVIPLNIKYLIIEVKELRRGYDNFLKDLKALYVICTLDNCAVKTKIKIHMRKSFIQKQDPDFDKKFNKVIANHVKDIKTVIINR